MEISMLQYNGLSRLYKRAYDLGDHYRIGGFNENPIRKFIVRDNKYLILSILCV